MKCSNCGATIEVNESCSECGIRYLEMFNLISHPEMKRLFKRIEKLQSEGEDMAIEESLIAVELLNSSMIQPAYVNGENVRMIRLPGPDDKPYIVLFTDMEEYEKGMECLAPLFEMLEEDGISLDTLTPLTTQWKNFMKIMLDIDNGFLINVGSDSVILGRNFLEEYFSEDTYEEHEGKASP